MNKYIELNLTQDELNNVEDVLNNVSYIMQKENAGEEISFIKEVSTDINGLIEPQHLEKLIQLLEVYRHKEGGRRDEVTQTQDILKMSGYDALIKQYCDVIGLLKNKYIDLVEA